MKRISALILMLVFVLCGCTANVKISNDYYGSVDTKLVNPNADENAKKLYAFLKNNYGKKILSGQYINEYDDFSQDRFKMDENDPNSPMTVFKSNELLAVNSVTGEYPAVIGLDFSEIEIGRECYTTAHAIEWHKAGGIVTFCWHWIAPAQSEGKRHFYTEQTDFDLKKALSDTESEEYKGLIRDIDIVAEQLKILRDAGVPVLWRPLHEASGGWFWWGDSGAKAYKELWNIMFDRMTNVHNLTNLIWVYNAQNANWYVGDDKCDIIGDDPYYTDSLRENYEKDTANAKRFKKTYKTSQNKIIMMSENDFVPNIDEVFSQNVKWSMFCTWCRDFVCVPAEGDGISWGTMTPQYSNRCTTEQELKEIYDDERVITLNRLVESKEYFIAE